MSDDISQVIKQINEVLSRRAQIKEDYIKAWLAVNVPDDAMNPEWLINNVRLVETCKQAEHGCGMNYSWHLELKEKVNHEPQR